MSVVIQIKPWDGRAVIRRAMWIDGGRAYFSWAEALTFPPESIERLIRHVTQKTIEDIAVNIATLALLTTVINQHQQTHKVIKAIYQIYQQIGKDTETK